MLKRGLIKNNKKWNFSTTENGGWLIKRKYLKRETGELPNTEKTEKRNYGRGILPKYLCFVLVIG